MKKILLLLGLLGLSYQASAYDLDQLQIHGFASQGYLKSNHYDYYQVNSEDGTFQFNEFGLNVLADLPNRLRVGMQLFSRDFGDIGNNKVIIDWAFGEYRYRNWLGFRIGKLKKVRGLYNQSRDIDAARTGVFLPYSVYSETLRSIHQSVIGLDAYGLLPGGFEYTIQYGTLDHAVAEELFDKGIDDVELKTNYEVTLGWETPLEGLRIVGSWGGWSFDQTQSRTVDDVTTTEESELDFTEPIVGLEYLHGPFMLAAEYRQVQSDQKTSESYYGLGSYRVNDWFEVGTSYAISYRDKDDRTGDNYDQLKARAWMKDLAVSTRFDITESWIVKLEGHWLNGLYGVSGYERNNPSEDGFLIAAKATFSF